MLDTDYVRVVHAEKTLKPDGTAHIGVVVAAGEILDGDQPPGTIGGSSTARLIREARLDDDVKALVLRIDSPGGSVLASEEIYRELLALKAAGKPLVVSMGDLAASGGYYIAAPADEIWASPATITGSIGIFAIIPTIDRSLDKLGVHVDGVGTTPLSGQLRLDRPLGERAKMLLQSSISHGYDEFLAARLERAQEDPGPDRCHRAGPGMGGCRREAPRTGGSSRLVRRCRCGRCAARQPQGV